MSQPIRNLEDLSAFKLDAAGRARLLEETNECIVTWTNKAGWPMGMPHSFVWAEGKFWVHTTTKRHRVKALTERPQSGIVISNKGTEMFAEAGAAMISAKTLATVHHGDRERVQWLLPLFFDRVGMGPDPDSRAEQMALLDTPARVVISFDPVEEFSYDSGAVSRAALDSGFALWSKRTWRPGQD